MLTKTITTIAELVSHLGGAGALARARGVRPEAVRNWIYRGSIGGRHRVALKGMADAAGLLYSDAIFDRVIQTNHVAASPTHDAPPHTNECGTVPQTVNERNLLGPSAVFPDSSGLDLSTANHADHPQPNNGVSP